MPYVQPTPGDRHVNRALTNLSVAFMQEEEGFVAHRTFLPVPVGQKSNAYRVYPIGTFSRDQMKRRAPSTESPSVTYELSHDTYLCDVWSLATDIDDQDRANTDNPADDDIASARLLTEAGMIRRERAWAEDFLKTGAWTFEVHGAESATTPANFDPTNRANDDVAFWNNSASDPIELVRMLKRAIQRATGRRPNVLTLGREAYDALLDHGDIVGRLDRGQTIGPAIATRDALAALFELEEILVMDAIYNNAAEGQDASMNFIGGKNGLLSYRPPAASMRTPAAGYTFYWTAMVGMTNGGMRIKRFREEKIASDRIEIEMAWDQKLIAADLGCFLGGIVQ